MMRIYVAGPMTGYPDLNFPLFNRVTAALRARGFDVVNPVEVNAEADAAFLALPAVEQELRAREHWRACMRRDIAALMTCEGIALLPGWARSSGARLEEHNGMRLGMSIRLAHELVPEAFTAERAA